VAEKVALSYNQLTQQAPDEPMHSPRISLDPGSLRQLLSDLLNRASQPVQVDSVPLFIADNRCGWLFSSAAQALTGLNGVDVSQGAAHIGRSMSAGAELNALLATVAITLRQAGCAPGWRNELLDVWPEQADDPARPLSSKPLGAIERGVVRPLGLLTKAVHLNGWSQDGRLWVARRSLTKATDPGMWDTLVGGLISSQEDVQVGLVREADEEAGLEPEDIAGRTPLRTIARMLRQVPEGYQAEDVLTCECVLPPHVTPKNRDGEVMEIQLIAPSSIFNMLAQGAFTLEASIVVAEDLLQRATPAPV
jgi:8-oxo-dGTP pyrophosphatase MutT (NUDIX family)